MRRAVGGGETTPSAQSTHHVLMVEPQAFCSNPQTQATNAFQAIGKDEEEGSTSTIQTMARAEFMAFRQQLINHGVIVTTVKGTPQTPDDVFCNNWVSTHGGVVVTYPLLAENRRQEVREDVLSLLRPQMRIDLTPLIKEGEVLESTGSLVLDRVNKIAYSALSERTTANAVGQWAKQMGYTPITFCTAGPNGQPVYHTNVLLFIGSGYAGLCLEVIAPQDRAAVKAQLEKHHHVTEITPQQMAHFCGNCLEVVGGGGLRYLVMSAAAEKAFTAQQKKALLQNVTGFITADLSTIEHYGGGSARCMLLEVFA